MTSIVTPLELVAAGIELHYANHVVEADDGFVDFHVVVDRPYGLRRFVRPQVIFRCDSSITFKPLPVEHAFPVLEWGMNWCISSHCHQYLIIHAAVVEKNGNAVIMPSPSGSGKSTLCAGLVNRGWRLLSDELAILDPLDGSLVSVPRPVSLKNTSIDVIRKFAPAARFGAIVGGTLKGNVGHVQPPRESVARQFEHALPRWIVLPRYSPDAPLGFKRLTRGRAFMHLLENAFNYDVHGTDGFELLAATIEKCDSFEFQYSDLEQAAVAFERLAAGDTLVGSA